MEKNVLNKYKIDKNIYNYLLSANQFDRPTANQSELIRANPS